MALHKVASHYPSPAPTQTLRTSPTVWHPTSTATAVSRTQSTMSKTARLAHSGSGLSVEFCHQVLWPCLHCAVPDAPRTKFFFESAAFKQYVAVNKRFTKAIESVWTECNIDVYLSSQTGSFLMRKSIQPRRVDSHWE